MQHRLIDLPRSSNTTKSSTITPDTPNTSSCLISTFKPSTPHQKILISPTFGAGWVTWARSNDKGFIAWLITYQPLINLIEAENHFQEVRDQIVVQHFKIDDCAEASR